MTGGWGCRGGGGGGAGAWGISGGKGGGGKGCWAGMWSRKNPCLFWKRGCGGLVTVVW